jgi:hypothetical protein
MKSNDLIASEIFHLNNSNLVQNNQLFSHLENAAFNYPNQLTHAVAYTKEERRLIIERFRAKKLRRIWNKQVKYDCRKRLADTRPRVKGRFVSKKETMLLDDIDKKNNMETSSST